jgi:hypothetical protein
MKGGRRISMSLRLCHIDSFSSGSDMHARRIPAASSQRIDIFGWERAHMRIGKRSKDAFHR